MRKKLLATRRRKVTAQNAEMKTTVKLSNPELVHPPLGAYSHSASVPAGAELFFISGQLGVRPDGSIAASLAQQADQVFANLSAVLRKDDLVVSDIAKLTIFVVAGQDASEVRDARLKHLGSHRPASTLVYVSQLALPECVVEVEAVAVKAGRYR